MKSSPKGSPKRLDTLLVERGLAESRGRAQGLILAGSVRVGDTVVTKAGSRVSADEPLSVDQNKRFVSRAGEKLDAGASRGGFTDALLQRGAEKVLAVDVGYGQFDWSLRNDPRVTVMERTNVRHLTGEDLPFDSDLLVADLSFISLTVALEGIFSSTPALQEAILLVKPQFEAGPEAVGRGGLVRDRAVHAAVILGVAGYFGSLGFGAGGVTQGAIAGRKSGNVEYPVHLLRGTESALDEARIREVVGVG